MTNEEIEKQFKELNYKCDEVYSCGQFPPEVLPWVLRLSEYSKDVVNDFDRRKACCLGRIFPLLAIFGSRKRVKVIFKLKDVQQ